MGKFKMEGFPTHLTGINSKSPVKSSSSQKAIGSGVATGAAQGASMGMMLGPWGAAGGALIGGAIGGIQASEAHEQKLKDDKVAEDHRRKDLKAQAGIVAQEKQQAQEAANLKGTQDLSTVSSDDTARVESTPVSSSTADLERLYSPVDSPAGKKSSLLYKINKNKDYINFNVNSASQIGHETKMGILKK